MNSYPNRIASPTGGTVGGAGMARAGALSLSTAPILPRRAPYVKQPLAEQAAQLAARHRGLAVFHRERSARWLEYAHVSPWHAAQWRFHIDEAARHEALAERHARICAALEGAES